MGSTHPQRTLTEQQRLQRLEDREAIRELAALYMFILDEHDEEGLRRIFTDDACLESDGGDLYTARGRDNIIAMFRERFSELGPEFHISLNHLIRFDDENPDIAYGLVAAQAQFRKAGVATLSAMRYRDTYRRDDGKWRFARRRTGLMYYLPATEFAAGYATADSIRFVDGTRTSSDWPWLFRDKDKISTLRSFY